MEARERKGRRMMYKGVWAIDYTIVPQQFLEKSIDRLIDAKKQEPDRWDEIDEMIVEIRTELVRRLYWQEACATVGVAGSKQ